MWGIGVLLELKYNRLGLNTQTYVDISMDVPYFEKARLYREDRSHGGGTTM